MTSLEIPWHFWRSLDIPSKCWICHYCQCHYLCHHNNEHYHHQEIGQLQLQLKSILIRIATTSIWSIKQSSNGLNMKCHFKFSLLLSLSLFILIRITTSLWSIKQSSNDLNMKFFTFTLYLPWCQILARQNNLIGNCVPSRS